MKRARETGASGLIKTPSFRQYVMNANWMMVDPVRNFNLIILRASRSDDDDPDRSKVGEATLLRVRSSSDVPAFGVDNTGSGRTRSKYHALPLIGVRWDPFRLPSCNHRACL